MIKKFLQEGTQDDTWSLENFRQALGSKGHEIKRKQMTAFLQRKGPQDGQAAVIYQLVWEFFKRVGPL